jgi:hypothetical protein
MEWEVTQRVEAILKKLEARGGIKGLRFKVAHRPMPTIEWDSDARICWTVSVLLGLDEDPPDEWPGSIEVMGVEGGHILVRFHPKKPRITGLARPLASLFTEVFGSMVDEDLRPGVSKEEAMRNYVRAALDTLDWD